MKEAIYSNKKKWGSLFLKSKSMEPIQPFIVSETRICDSIPIEQFASQQRFVGFYSAEWRCWCWCCCSWKASTRLHNHTMCCGPSERRTSRRWMTRTATRWRWWCRGIWIGWLLVVGSGTEEWSKGMRWRKRVRERDRGKGFEYSQYNDFRATITTFYL